MRSAIVVFPGSNCDNDLFKALKCLTKNKIHFLWHKEKNLPNDIDIIFLPGGFSYGDYLRSGAIASNSPIMNEVIKFINKGGYVVGICNGFQILTETKILPGILLRNQKIKFICGVQKIKISSNKTIFTQNLSKKKSIIKIPISHHDGNYFCDSKTLNELEDEERVVFRYIKNPNGSLNNIAGIVSKNRRVLGMMPHPERPNKNFNKGISGKSIFVSMISNFN